MIVSEIARRYARALYAVASEKKQADQYLAELRGVSKLVTDNKDIGEFLNSPTASVEVKAKALEAAFAGKVQQEILNTLLLLVEKGRFPQLEEITSAFETETDLARGVTRGTVRSASALEPDQRKSLEETAKKLTGKQVLFKYDLDPSLVGGLVAQVEGWSFDDSLTSHLTSLKEELKNNA